MSEPATIEQPAARGSALIGWARRRARDLAPFVTLMVLVIFFSLTTDSFLNVINLRNVLAQIATLAVVSTGITFVLLCGEIDLSIAAVATMTGVVAAVLFGTVGLPGGLAVLGGAGAATALGLLNGWGTTRVGLPSFMATLATMQIAAGLGQYITKGQIVYTLAPTLTFLGGEYIGQSDPWRLPVVILVGAAALLLGHLGRPVERDQHQKYRRRLPDDLGVLGRTRGHVEHRPPGQRPGVRAGRHAARQHLGGRAGRHVAVRRRGRDQEHSDRPADLRCAQQRPQPAPA
jgi:ABC-type xylose transport system permease subunit